MKRKDCYVIENSKIIMFDIPVEEVIDVNESNSLNKIKTVASHFNNHPSTHLETIFDNAVLTGSCRPRVIDKPAMDNDDNLNFTESIFGETKHELKRKSKKYGDFVTISAKVRNSQRSSSSSNQNQNEVPVVPTGVAAIPHSTPLQCTDNPDSDDNGSINSFSEVYIAQEMVRACLEKDPSERTESDITSLCSFMERFSAFSNITHGVRLAMCQAMVFAVVEKAGSVVLSEGEELDSWSIIINGQVELIKQGQETVVLNSGDCFGIKPTLQKQYHQGIMRTKTDDCQFVCVIQPDFFRIFNEGQVKLRHFEEDGQVVMVTEHRVSDGGMRQGQVVIKATSDRLMHHLVEDHSEIDPTYIEDYLLTYRVFYHKPLELADYLYTCFLNGNVIDKVTKILILWVNSQFKDFSSCQMTEFLEKIEKQYEQRKLFGQTRLLNMTIHMNSPIRHIELEKSTKENKLDFSIISSKENGGEIYIYYVDPSSKSELAGLKRGDQLLEVNNFSFKNLTVIKALDILHQTNQLSMLVKHNKMGFRSLIEGNSLKKDSTNKSVLNDLEKSYDLTSEKTSKKKGSFLYTLFKNLNTGSNSSSNFYNQNYGTLSKDTKIDDGSIDTTFKNNQLPSSVSSFNYTKDNLNLSNQNMHIIRVFKPDHTCRYFHIEKETTVGEVIKMCLEAFNIVNNIVTKNFLFQVTVTPDRLVKHRCLQENYNNLANRIPLSARYYLKTSSAEGTMPDEIIQEMINEAAIVIWQIDSVEVARGITLMDFELYKSIHSVEYIYDLFIKNKTPEHCSNLDRLTKITNNQMFWVIKEILRENQIMKRVKIIKFFINLSKSLKVMRSYNALFSVLSGLDHSSVRRLKLTWEKVPSKYLKVFEELQKILNPSWNMATYRNLINGCNSAPPLVPILPIVKKDLTFLHLGNETFVDNLVNFEKLRMISREIRAITNFFSINYDPVAMIEAARSNTNANINANVNTNYISTNNNLPTTSQSSINSSSSGVNMSGTIQSSNVSNLTSSSVSSVNSLNFKSLTLNNSTQKRMAFLLANPKRHFEEFITRIKVTNYLNELENMVTMNENDLRAMSYECEPNELQLNNHLAATNQSTINLPVSSNNSIGSGLSKCHPTISEDIETSNHLTDFNDVAV